jgi:signal transduction histidine kinase
VIADIAANEILEGAPASPTARGFVEDILEAFGGGEVAFARAQALGAEWHAQGGHDVAALWRELARLARAVEDALDPRFPEAADRRRLRAAVDEATGHALAAFGAARRARRDRWLSYFAHEMRNSLNTMVNANWIVRNAEGRPPAKICDMTDRAVRKLEGLVKELRDLENQAAKPAPGRQDKV